MTSRFGGTWRRAGKALRRRCARWWWGRESFPLPKRRPSPGRTTPPKGMKACQRCGKPRVRRAATCGQCVRNLLFAMRKSGYLTPVPWDSRAYRTSGHREAVYETKYGVNR